MKIWERERERERERYASGWITRLAMIICYKLLKDQHNLNPGAGAELPSANDVATSGCWNLEALPNVNRSLS